MKDSNSLHAVCRDTFPPLVYMNETSDFLVKFVNVINNINTKEKKTICGYTFDAGPNCFIFTEKKYESIIISLIEGTFNDECFSFFNSRLENLNNNLNLGICLDLNELKSLFEERKSRDLKIEDVVSFCGGEGAKII